MSIYEAIGMLWVVFTSALATVAVLYLAYLGLMQVINKNTVLHINSDISVTELIERVREVKA